LIARTPRVFALLANHKVYDVEGAARALRLDTWTLPHGELLPGDRLVFWRTLGDDKKRGVVAMGRAISAPTLFSSLPQSHPYWKGERPEEARRFLLEYLPYRGLPLWLDEDDTGLLASLTVSRGQGNKLFQVSPQQWDQLERLALGARAPAPPLPAPPLPAPSLPLPPLPDATPNAPSLAEVEARIWEHLRRYPTLTEEEITRLAGGARQYRRLLTQLQDDPRLQIEVTPHSGVTWRLRTP
jgi:hypothetical protein